MDGARGAEVEQRKRWHPSGETFFYEGRLSPPEIPEPRRRQLGVAHCVLNVAVPKVGLQGASVVSFVRQRVGYGWPATLVVAVVIWIALPFLISQLCAAFVLGRIQSRTRRANGLTDKIADAVKGLPQKEQEAVAKRMIDEALK
jgi:hypothetical protein